MKKALLSLLLVFSLVVGITSAQPVFAQQTPSPATSKPAKREQTVYFNTESRKFHKHSCRWAKKCTVNCITIPRSEAIQRGGVPCKVCGG